MRVLFGAIAQLGERYTGSVEVGGSIPPGSTKVKYFRGLALKDVFKKTSPSSRGLGHRPFTAVTGVRIPLGTPLLQKAALCRSVAFFVWPRRGFSISVDVTYRI